MKKLLGFCRCGRVLALAAAVPGRAQSVERREIGNQILENVPIAPPSIREGLARYQNACSAYFDDWASNGGMVVTTRFGNTNQLHLVAGPGADRSQITFYDEPVGSAQTLPSAGPDPVLQGHRRRRVVPTVPARRRRQDGPAD
ncbi:hypothetical protein ACRAWD_23300 [Caulobacter segnis]